jgi:hypothetical protein
MCFLAVLPVEGLLSFYTLKILNIKKKSRKIFHLQEKKLRISLYRKMFASEFTVSCGILKNTRSLN